MVFDEGGPPNNAPFYLDTLQTSCLQMGCSAAGKPPMHRLQRIIRIRSPALFIFKPFFIISSARGCTPPHDPVTTPVSTVETLDILFNKQIRTALFLHSSGHMQHTPSLTSSLATSPKNGVFENGF